jgi:uncharacterized protein
MQAPLKHTVHGQTLWLSAARSIYWEEMKTLVVADLHFGKTGHFRKSSIAIPQALYQNDLQKLFTQIQFYKPQQLIIAGDMFHSNANLELEHFKKWRNDHEQLTIQLVQGNHDILHKQWYRQMSIDVIDNLLHLQPFCFMHDIKDAAYNTESNYMITGHIHPGIRIRGGGRQSLQFPCFYFSENYAVLPAFSDFTGLYAVKPLARDAVYAILPGNTLRGEQATVLQIQ